MTSLYLSDILNRAGIDPKSVMLIRHSMNEKVFKKCADDGKIMEYTKHQGEYFARGAKYWMVFIAGKSTTARYYACYEVTGNAGKAKNLKCPQDFPAPEWYQNDDTYVYNLKETDILEDLENRLVIDWGKATAQWYQWGYNKKPVVAIQAEEKKEFVGYENILLSYNELVEIVENDIAYEQWHTALKNVHAIYLIADRKDGELYVGSTWGYNGLLGRWTTYANTQHGGNKKIIEKLAKHPNRYKEFQYTVLQVLPKTILQNEINKIENFWKKKLLSKEFGMNDN